MIKEFTLICGLAVLGQSLNASELSSQTDDSLLLGVTQLSEAQMQSVTGEDIMYRFIFPESGKASYETVGYSSSSDRGFILINGDTGKTLDADIRTFGPNGMGAHYWYTGSEWCSESFNY